MKKKILISCDHYLPSFRAGGPVRSIAAIVNILKQDAAISIVTRNRDCGIKTPFENLSPNQYGYPVHYFSIKKAIVGIFNLLRKESFDILYCNSFFSPIFAIYPVLLNHFIFRQKIKMIIAPRGELGSGALIFNSTRKKIYLFLMRRFLEKNIVWHATSLAEEKEIKTALGDQANIIVLANISSATDTTLARKIKKENQLNIVFISRIIGKKNLEFALKALSQVKGPVLFDIYGPIEELVYWQACLQLIKHLPPHIVVNYQGALTPEKVSETLCQYDLFFLPTLNENYGHAIVEAFCVGCPVLISTNTPWRHLSAVCAGWDIALENPADFSNKIEELILMNDETYHVYQTGALHYFNQHIRNSSLDEDYKHHFLNT